jgi:hypothetical protein
MKAPGLTVTPVWISAPEEAGDTGAQVDGQVHLPVAGERPLLRSGPGRPARRRKSGLGWGLGTWALGMGCIARAYIARAPCNKVSCAAGRVCPAFGLGK